HVNAILEEVKVETDATLRLHDSESESGGTDGLSHLNGEAKGIAARDARLLIFRGLVGGSRTSSNIGLRDLHLAAWIVDKLKQEEARHPRLEPKRKIVLKRVGEEVVLAPDLDVGLEASGHTDHIAKAL